MRSLFFGNAAQRKGIRSTVITALYAGYEPLYRNIELYYVRTHETRT